MLRGIATIRRDPLAFLAEQWRAHGDVVQFPIPAPPTYLVSHPADVRQVLVGRARDTGKDTLQYRALSQVTGLGLLTSDGERWREHRRVLQPAFHPSTLPGVAEHTTDAAQGLVDRLLGAPGSSVVDLDAAVMALALEVVGESLFGHALGPVADRLAAATLTALGEVVALARMPLRAPRWVPTPGNRRMTGALAELDAAVAAILEQRHAQGPSDPPRMVDLLLASELSQRAVRDEIVTFLVAGHETVASALTWALVLLGGQPAIADAVAAEAVQVLGPDPGVRPGPDLGSLAKLELARAVVDEAMRLHPPAWLITRRTSADLTLGGCAVPAGSLVVISPWLVHRHPSAWPDPDAFDPERFRDPGNAASVRAAFLPFGAGPRMCIGRDFAYAEAVLALAMVCRAVRFAPTGAPVRALPLVTIRPDRPVFMRITAR
ncbi:MAG TPA: cytochrome P450 [Candidatus Nanopelagicales bacterium]